MHQLAGFRIKNVKRFPESRPPDPRGGRKTPPASTPVRPPMLMLLRFFWAGYTALMVYMSIHA